MRTYEGVWVDINTGVPTIKDIAVMQGRMCRYNGACKVYWPVLLHSLAVNQLVSYPNKIHALLHDAAEVIISDIPRTVKPKEMEAVEEVILRRIYNSLDLEWPSQQVWDEVYKADDRILAAECRVFGPPGILNSFPWMLEEDTTADHIIHEFLRKLDVRECISPYGDFVLKYEKYVKIFLTYPTKEYDALVYENVL